MGSRRSVPCVLACPIECAKQMVSVAQRVSDLLLGLIFLVELIGLPAFIVWSVTPDSIRYPLFYATIYQVNTAQVHVEKLPSDCDFWYAPLGDKASGDHCQDLSLKPTAVNFDRRRAFVAIPVVMATIGGVAPGTLQ